MQLLPWRKMLFVICLSTICFQQESKALEAGFAPLFDGKTLVGWNVEPKTKTSDWTVRDGVIVGQGGRGQSYLAWKDKGLADFELKLSYRLPEGKGNTGIDIRGRTVKSGRRRYESYHADLGHAGIGPHILGAWDFHFTKRKEHPCNRGTRLVIGTDEKGGSSKISGALTKADIRPRQWNDVRVIARGNHFQFFINDKIAAEFTDNAKQGRLDKGVIRLQIHDKGMHVEFKDIRLKRLAPASQSQEPVSVGLQKQLLVDDYIIAEKHNVTRELGKVKKVGIVMKPSLDTDFHPSWKKPDGSRVALDFGYYTSVIRNEKTGKFQMWYMAYRSSGVGYAESKDGIRWTKPLVGKDGKNNIVHRSQGFSCTIDPSVPWGHAEKYKGAADFADRGCCVAICYSSDGIHWHDYNGGKPVSHRAADTHNQFLWDPLIKSYRLLTRTDLGGEGGISESRSTRIMVHAAENDVKKHPTAWRTVIDKIRVEDPKKEKNRWGKPRLQFNGMTMWIHEGVYFGLMDVYTMGQSHFFDGFDYKTRHDDDYMDFYIGVSRDGMNFDKSWIYARKPLVPRGPAGSFDKDGVKPPAQIVTYKDEHWIFYGGMDERHYSKGRHLNIGLAKLRLDGFVCLAAADKPGVVVTKPFKCEGDMLEVNVDAKDGSVRVELLDENGKAIPGFSGAAAKQYKGADELRLTPQWKSGGVLSSLKGKTIKLKFTLQNARLYAFDFKLVKK
jgi:hypothetical protein